MDGRRRRMRIGQVVIAEVTLVGVVLASVGPGWLLLGAAAAAAAVGVATFGRSGGRWWYEAVATRRRFAQRRRRAAADVVAATLAGRAPAALVWLRTLAPELVPRRVSAGEAQVGVCADESGWFAAVAIADGASINVGHAMVAELVELLEPGPDRVALSTVQLVRSGQQAWVALRLSAVDAVPAGQAAGLGGIEALVAAAVVRVTRLLRKHGYEAVALDSVRLLATLVAANGLDGAPQEHWSSWSSGNLTHTTYAASGWPPEPLLAVPGVWAVSASFVRAHRGQPRSDDGPGQSGDDQRDSRRGSTAPIGGFLVRVAAEPVMLAPACRDVLRAATRCGVRLRRLDGDQAPAAYACGPSAAPAHELSYRFLGSLGDGVDGLPPARGSSAPSLGSVPRDH